MAKLSVRSLLGIGVFVLFLLTLSTYPTYHFRLSSKWYPAAPNSLTGYVLFLVMVFILPLLLLALASAGTRRLVLKLNLHTPVSLCVVVVAGHFVAELIKINLTEFAPPLLNSLQLGSSTAKILANTTSITVFLGTTLGAFTGERAVLLAWAARRKEVNQWADD